VEHDLLLMKTVLAEKKEFFHNPNGSAFVEGRVMPEKLVGENECATVH